MKVVLKAPQWSRLRCSSSEWKAGFWKDWRFHSCESFIQNINTTLEAGCDTCRDSNHLWIQRGKYTADKGSKNVGTFLKLLLKVIGLGMNRQ